MLMAVSLEEAARAAGRRRHPHPGGGVRAVGRHRPATHPGRAMDPIAPLRLPRRRAPAHRGGAVWAASLHAGRRRHRVRARCRVPARDAAQGAGGRRRDAAGRAAPPSPAGAALAPPRPAARGPGGPRRALGDGAAADRAGDGTRPARRLDVPRPGAAAPRPLPDPVPGLLPPPGPPGLGAVTEADLRLGRPGRLRRRAAAGAHPARRRRDRLGVGPSLRPLADRPGVPGEEGGRRGRRYGHPATVLAEIRDALTVAA